MRLGDRAHCLQRAGRGCRLGHSMAQVLGAPRGRSGAETSPVRSPAPCPWRPVPARRSCQLHHHMAQLGASFKVRGPSAASLGHMLGTRLQCAHLALGQRSVSQKRVSCPQNAFYVPKKGKWVFPIIGNPRVPPTTSLASPGAFLRVRACLASYAQICA